jgi:hypothetical protein
VFVRVGFYCVIHSQHRLPKEVTLLFGHIACLGSRHRGLWRSRTAAGLPLAIRRIERSKLVDVRRDSPLKGSLRDPFSHSVNGVSSGTPKWGQVWGQGTCPQSRCLVALRRQRHAASPQPAALIALTGENGAPVPTAKESLLAPLSLSFLTTLKEVRIC